MKISLVDKLIINMLQKNENLTTYQIAKELKVSWATVNTHCYKLKAMGIIDGKFEESISGKKMVWWLTKKNLKNFMEVKGR